MVPGFVLATSRLSQILDWRRRDQPRRGGWEHLPSKQSVFEDGGVDQASRVIIRQIKCDSRRRKQGRARPSGGSFGTALAQVLDWGISRLCPVNVLSGSKGMFWKKQIYCNK
jgi:hypothetical protein